MFFSRYKYLFTVHFVSPRAYKHHIHLWIWVAPPGNSEMFYMYKRRLFTCSGLQSNLGRLILFSCFFFNPNILHPCWIWEWMMDLIFTTFTLGQKSSSTSLWLSSISVLWYVWTGTSRLSRIKKVELWSCFLPKLFFKVSQIIFIDLHFFCSVNRSHNRIHVHQAWRAIFYCIHPVYWWPVLEFKFRIGAININSWFWINLC